MLVRILILHSSIIERMGGISPLGGRPRFHRNMARRPPDVSGPTSQVPYPASDALSTLMALSPES